jgi:hypothetical protein
MGCVYISNHPSVCPFSSETSVREGQTVERKRRNAQLASNVRKEGASFATVKIVSFNMA